MTEELIKKLEKMIINIDCHEFKQDEILLAKFKTKSVAKSDEKRVVGMQYIMYVAYCQNQAILDDLAKVLADGDDDIISDWYFCLN